MRMYEILAECSELRLRDAITKILSDKGLRMRFWEEGKRLVRDVFGWGKIVRRVEMSNETTSHLDKLGGI